MINRRRLLILAILGATAALIWYILRDVPSPTKVKKRPTPSVKASESVPRLNGRRVLNLPPGKEKEALEELKVSNKVSEEWEKAVEKALRIQGGEDLKEVTITKVESLIWTGPGFALNVESVKIGLKDKKGERTSFRALIDSQTGKILQTWDQPVIDPINPRQGFGIKVDPRYHGN